jgi:hypothetical protein
MKSLQESLFDSKTQMAESLFDKDLVEKDPPIDLDDLKEMLYNLIPKNSSIPKNNSDIVFHKGNQLIYIKRFIDDSQDSEKVCFELVFGVTTLFKDLKGGQQELLPCFSVPLLRVHDRILSVNMMRSKEIKWSTSESDPTTTARLIDKEFDFRKNTDKIYTTTEIIATQRNVVEILDFYDRLIKYFCSDKFGKVLKDYVDKFEWKRAIPGIVMDIILKKLITQS